MFSIILIAALLVMLMSVSGVVFMHFTARQFLETRLPFLISFSAGIFLVTAGALALEVFELAMSWWQGALIISTGYLAATLLHKLLPETHHHHDMTCHRSHGGAKKLIIGDAIHNIADGIILAAAFLVSPTLGVAVLFSIIVHEVLQEISEFFVLRQAGYTVPRALIINGAVSSTILIGVGLGYLAVSTAFAEMVLLGLSAGFFLQVVAHDLLPRRKHHASTTHFSKHVLIVSTGVFVMALVSQLTAGIHVHSDTHSDGEEHHEEHNEEHHEEYTHDSH